MKEVSRWVRAIEIPIEKRANAARASQWQQSGEFVRAERGCPQCGGWYLQRKDDQAGITLHFAGCYRLELSLFENMMGWSERAKLGKGASTCSAECRRKLTAIRRRMADATKCRTCGVPSTIAERREFNKWRAAQPGYVKPVGRGRPQMPPCSGCGHKKYDHKKKGCKGKHWEGPCPCTQYRTAVSTYAKAAKA